MFSSIRSNVDASIIVIMWDIATGDQGGWGLARFVGTINGEVTGCKIRPMFAAPGR